MIFGEKNVVGPEKNFASQDLYQYVENLLKESIQRSKSYEERSYYSWLKSRELQDSSVEHYLQDLRPMINKMSSENCAAVAVKLDNLTDKRNFPISDLLTLIKQVLLEQDNMSLVEETVKGARETKNGKRVNKVHPELSGRQATVSFIVESNFVSQPQVPVVALEALLTPIRDTSVIITQFTGNTAAGRELHSLAVRIMKEGAERFVQHTKY